MNCAKTAKPGSPTYRVIECLVSAGEAGATSMEIAKRAGVVCPSTYISSLRHMGRKVRREFVGVSESGAKVHRYWLAETT